MSGRVCTYVRHVVTHALEGELDALFGVVSTNCCDHVRRAADVFAKKVGLAWGGFVSIPRATRESLLPYYRRQLERLLADLSAATGAGGGEDDLRRAIAEVEAVRAVLRRLDAARRGPALRLTGAEALTAHVAAQVLPARDFLALAGPLADAVDARAPLPEPRARVVLTGAALDEPAYVAVLESQGAAVVGDRLCFGARAVLDPIDATGPDPLGAIARAYFHRASCARMIGDFGSRWADLLALVDSSRADGVVFERLLFCDPWGADQHNGLARAARDGGPPLLVLEREYGIVPTGQVRTRIQAFVERLEIDRARRGTPGGGS
jgi:benzoyl-CoA reductase/2-hydroxyglutaryl-CoA dehydratase subunit BcrC/BadD/HgdB